MVKVNKLAMMITPRPASNKLRELGRCPHYITVDGVDHLDYTLVIVRNLETGQIGFARLHPGQTTPTSKRLKNTDIQFSFFPQEAAFVLQVLTADSDQQAYLKRANSRKGRKRG